MYKNKYVMDCGKKQVSRNGEFSKTSSLKTDRKLPHWDKPRPSTFCLLFLLSLFIVLNWFSIALLSTMT